MTTILHNQNMETLPMDKTPIDYICSLFHVDYVRARIKLASFGLRGTSHVKKISDLSKTEQELLAQIPKNCT